MAIITITILQDIIVTFVLAGGHFVGGVLQGFYGDEWNDDEYDNDDGRTIKRSMIASAVSPCIITLTTCNQGSIHSELHI